MHSLDEVQRKNALRNRHVIVNKGGFNQNQPSNSKQKDDQPNVVQEEGYKGMFYQEAFINSVNDGFEEDLSPLIYDEYEDDYLDNAPEEPPVCNHGLDHLE